MGAPTEGPREGRAAGRGADGPRADGPRVDIGHYLTQIQITSTLFNTISNQFYTILHYFKYIWHYFTFQIAIVD